MSWYVIEGPDDTGKTTLAQGLARRGWIYEHADSRDHLEHLAGRLAARQDDEYVVWDRCHLGELVHAPLDRGYQPSLGWTRLIEAFLLTRGTHCILLRVRHNTAETWENDHTRQRQLLDAFDQAAAVSTLRWYGWPDPMPLRLDPWREPERFIWSEDRVDPEGLGSREPLVWVLGEQESRKTPVPWPFATRCGIELVWPTINPQDVRVSNVMRRLPQKTIIPSELHLRWEDLNQPAVVALGRTAETACVLADIPVSTTLPHPQHHLRFHARQAAQYHYWLSTAILKGMKQRLIQPEELTRA